MDSALGEVPNPQMMSSMQQLITEITARYGSIDAFCARLHQLLDEATDEIPRVPRVEAPRPMAGGRHRLRAPHA
ncbi:hypothetical protein ACFVMC_30565 [Nocardia sp. NPDC127579]|uniref:hypothetical protein n=1 Tax=Nocardia sp. NPDC127579 TaxID=3345402 RepID=UPI003644B7C2